MDALLGKVVMALELVPTSKRLFGNDIPQGNNKPPRFCMPEQSQKGLVMNARDRMVSSSVLGSDWASMSVRIKIIGPTGTGTGIVP